DAHLFDRAVEHAAGEFLPDAADGPRPHRRLSVPLCVRGETMGVLTVERVGELPAGERRALAALALHISAALENARLVARQRRFADELADKVRAATDRLEALDRAKSVFVAMASPELTPVRADPHALERILVNLLSNALKYSPTDTMVTVRARASTGNVVIAVEDAGRGIAPDALPRVFEPYFRAPDAVGRAPGSG